MWSWGNNWSGQLGDGTTEDKSTPICISDINESLKGKQIKCIDADGSWTVIMDSDNNDYVFGGWISPG